jgi:hypothetical protein
LFTLQAARIDEGLLIETCDHKHVELNLSVEPKDSNLDEVPESAIACARRSGWDGFVKCSLLKAN